MNPLYVLAAFAGAAVAQYSDPASHGFTINAPGLTNTASFGYGAGLSTGTVSRPATSQYVPLSTSFESQPRLVSERAFTLTNVGSVGGPTGSVIGERRLLTDSAAILPRQRVGAGVPASQIGYGGLGTTVVSLSGRSPPPALNNYFGGSTGGGRYVTAGNVGSPFNPTIQREPPRFQYAPPQSRGNYAPSHGYTVNAPGFTKHKTFAGPAVHGTNQAFLHASTG